MASGAGVPGAAGVRLVSNVAHGDAWNRRTSVGAGPVPAPIMIATSGRQLMSTVTRYCP